MMKRHLERLAVPEGIGFFLFLVITVLVLFITGVFLLIGGYNG